MPVRNTLGPDERLKREKQIETLFREGKAFSVFPLRIVWILAERTEGEKFPVRAGFSAAKKKFKRAVDRNRLKRLMRESWRIQKHPVYEKVPPGKQLHVFFLFTGNELTEQEHIHLLMQTAIIRLLGSGSPTQPADLKKKDT